MAVKTGAEVQAQIEQLAGKGLYAAALFFKQRVIATLSVAAPLARYRTNRAGRRGSLVQPRRATTPATPGAPPRMVTRRLRTSTAASYDPATHTARVGTSASYGHRLETKMGHPYLIPTLRANLSAIARIVGNQVWTGGNV